MATQDETKKVYPGNLATWLALRTARETIAQGTTDEADGTFTPADPTVVALYSIAEELAGLSYILDGIRYSTRKA